MISLLSKLAKALEPPAITRPRGWFAFAVAVTTALVQIALGPLGWFWVDEVLDVAAMLAISRAIGFHAVLLPTFALEFIPFTDFLPTWTGAVALVLGLRRRRGLVPPPPADFTPSCCRPSRSSSFRSPISCRPGPAPWRSSSAFDAGAGWCPRRQQISRRPAADLRARVHSVHRFPADLDRRRGARPRPSTPARVGAPAAS